MSPTFKLLFVGQFPADRAAVLVLLERFQLVLIHRELGHDREDRLGVDGKLRERHRSIFIFAADPVERRDGGHAIDVGDAVELGDLAHARNRQHPCEPVGIQAGDAVEDAGRGIGLVADRKEREQDHHQARQMAVDAIVSSDRSGLRLALRKM